MDGRRIALDVEPTVPDMVDLGLVGRELNGSVDLDCCAVVDGGHFAAVESGGGGEEVDVERARKEWVALELHSRVKYVRK